MSKKKRFERRNNRPSLAASLEAVRQGRKIVPTEREEPLPVEATVTTKHAEGQNEAAYVTAEVKRIGIIMGSLLALLVILSYLESSSSFLTKTVEGLVR